jgi:hypothetical protein
MAALIPRMPRSAVPGEHYKPRSPSALSIWHHRRAGQHHGFGFSSADWEQPDGDQPRGSLRYRAAAHHLLGRCPGSAWLTAMLGFTEHYGTGHPARPVAPRCIWVRRIWERPGSCWTPQNLPRRWRPNLVTVPGRSPSSSLRCRRALQHSESGWRRDRRRPPRDHLRRAQYRACDLGGHRWLFSTHARDVSSRWMGSNNHNQPAFTCSERVAEQLRKSTGLTWQSLVSRHATGDASKREGLCNDQPKPARTGRGGF